MASQFFGKNTLIHYNMARGSCNWEGNIQDEKAVFNSYQFSVSSEGSSHKIKLDSGLFYVWLSLKVNEFYKKPPLLFKGGSRKGNL